MGKSAPKPPAAPSPTATAAAQTASNKETAYWNAVLNNVNQITPYGSLTWSVNGRPTSVTGTGSTGSGSSGGTGSTGSTGSGSGTGGGTTSGFPSGLPTGAVRTNLGGAQYRLGTTYFRPNTQGGWESALLPGNGDIRGLQWSPYSGSNTSSGGSGSGTGSGSGSGGTSGGGWSGNGIPSYTSLGDTPPSFTSTIKLSPEQQALYESETRRNQALSMLGEDQIARIEQSVATPYSFAGLPEAYNASQRDGAATNAENAILSRLDPQFARDEEALRTRLLNQGIGQGSEAYNTEFDRFNQAKTDARMQAILQGANYGGALQDQSLRARNQAIQEYNAQRNAPLNEYSAITSGTQVTNPQFQNTGYAGANPVDYASLVNQQYQNQLGLYNQRVAGQNNTMNSLFGLGGQALGGFLGSNAGSALIAGMFSDERLKENINPVGIENGHNIYEFNYKGLPEKYIGVMAQEVEKTNPEAVGEAYGFKTVNYDKIGVKFRAA